MKYNSDEPSFHILICLIEIWKPKSKDDLDLPQNRDNVRMITECEKIEINESYKTLVGTANVLFPRGTVIKKTVTEMDMTKYDSAITVDTSDFGVVYETRTDSKKAGVDDFSIGDRIRISLGYTTEPRIAALTKPGPSSDPGKANTSIYTDPDKLSEYRSHLHIMFDGYIKKIGLDTPIELECENFAGNLKRVTCPKLSLKNATVNDLLGSDGKYKLLKNTGLTLDTKTAAQKITIGPVNVDSDFTIADEISRWEDMGLFAFVIGKELHVRRLYFTDPENDSILNAYPSASASSTIYFDYNVANNGLELMNTTKDFLVVEGTSIGEKDKTYHVSIRLNPAWRDGDKSQDKYQILNETSLSKKAKKKGAKQLSKIKKHVDLSEYTTVKFVSKKRNISNDALLDEAIKYFEMYNMNGISGSLTLFGDLHLHTAMHVELIDVRQPMKCGIYLVEEVTTKFGNDGYRQTIKLPYCISSIKIGDDNNSIYQHVKNRRQELGVIATDKRQQSNEPKANETNTESTTSKASTQKKTKSKKPKRGK